VHDSTFQYLKPSEQQVADMNTVRGAFAEVADVVLAKVPGSADRTYLLRKIRECAMWANVAITRTDDGTPRDGATVG
jgi:hypothetical protein